MLDLQWNFPLLPEQGGIWNSHFSAAVEQLSASHIVMQRPSFRTLDTSLRERAAAWLGFPAERVWLTAGGHHGTLNALLASGLAGGSLAVEGATYPGFLDQCRMTKTRTVACAIDEHGIIPEALRDVCERAREDGDSIGGLFTMPTVQNPVGFVTPLARREQIAEIAREFDLTVIEDDAYGYMEEDAPSSYAVLDPERTFYVRGLSKSLAPAARTGFLVAPDGASAALAVSLRCTATGTDLPQNLAALAMCEDGTLDTLMQAKRTEGAIRNAEARKLLGGTAAPGALCAWHLWVRLPSGLTPQDAEAAMRDAGVLVSGGYWCAAAPEYANGIRLALGGEIEQERTLEGVARVAAFLATSQ